MWTLTQTDDTLWYHVYENQDGEKMGGDRKRRAGASLQEGNTSSKRLKEALMMKEEEEEVAVNSVQNTEEEEKMLRDYFQLNVELGALYKEWKAADPHFKKVADIFTGKAQSKSDYNAVMIQFFNYYLHEKCLYHVLGVSQVCECCTRTPLNVCFPSSAPPTTTSLVSKAWWRDCVRLWVPHSASWIKPLTMTSLHWLHLQVCCSFHTDPRPLFMVLPIKHIYVM